MAAPRRQTSLPLARVELDELARIAIELGALEVGGPLSSGEKALVSRADRAALPGAALLRKWRGAIRKGADPLGDRFCEIRSSVERRSLGAFYTQDRLIEPMVAWVLDQVPTRVVDAGCGSGRFAMAVASRSNSEIVAVDVDPIATLLTRANLACRGLEARVVHADYTRLQLDDHGGRTAFIGNPPYVRHHDLPARLKTWARKESALQGVRSTALAGLHAYFYLSTAKMARDGDVGCFVTSAEWLDVGYGRLIRELMAGPLGGKALHVLSPKTVAFDDAMTTAAIACFEVGSSHTSMRMRSLERPEDLGDLERGRLARRDRLLGNKRWTSILKPKRTRAKGSLTLGDIARVHRGVVTGSNRFFVFTPERAAQLGISEFCRPAITSARQLLDAPGRVRAGSDTKLVLDLSSDTDPSTHKALAAYLRAGEAEGVSEGYVASHRRPWWRIGIGAAPPIVVSYMARQPPVFALNPDGMALLNIAHGIYPKKAMSKKALRRLVDTLNAHREEFRGQGRTYHGGLEKFEPKEMEALTLPDGCLD